MVEAPVAIYPWEISMSSLKLRALSLTALKNLIPILLVVAMITSVPDSSWAWGAMKWLFGNGFSELYLARNVLEKRPIYYCVVIYSPGTTTDASLDAQVRLAMTMYSSALDPKGIPSALVRVSCEDPRRQLHITMARDASPSLAYVAPCRDKDRVRLHMVLNLTSSDREGVSLLSDTLKLFDGGISQLRQSIGPAGDSRALTPAAFARVHGISTEVQRGSSWPTILHEMGHAFGLVDTYSGLWNEQADLRLLSKTQGIGVMSGMGYMNFMKDDLDGLRAIREAIRKKLKVVPVPESAAVAVGR
jgi:hypothetical protein